MKWREREREGEWDRQREWNRQRERENGGRDGEKGEREHITKTLNKYVDLIQKKSCANPNILSSEIIELSSQAETN